MTHGLLSAMDKREREERDRMGSLNRRWNRAMADLGLAGSEYVDEPERCAAHLKRMREFHGTLEVAKATKRFKQVCDCLQDFIDRYPSNVGVAAAKGALARLKGEK